MDVPCGPATAEAGKHTTLLDLADLLNHFGALSCAEAGQTVSEETDLETLLIDVDDGVEIRMSTRGTTLGFPTTTEEFWVAARDLEDEVVATWSSR